METKQKRGHEVRQCCNCGDTIRVPFSDARAGLGKYCSNACASQGRSYADAILDLLPATVYTIAENLGMKSLDAVKNLKRMVRKGLAHPSGIVLALRPSGSEYHTLVYSAGAAPVGVPVENLRETLIHFQRQAVIDAMPGIVSQLCERCGLSEATVRKFIKEMRGALDEQGRQPLVFIWSWRRPSGPFAPVYKAGPGKDVPCKLEPLTRAERYERYKSKLSRTGRAEEIRVKTNERRRAQRRQTEILNQGDPMLNALFGTPAERRGKDRRTSN